MTLVRLAIGRGLRQIIDGKLAEGWTKVSAAGNDAPPASSRWKFTDEEGRAWSAVSQLAPLSGDGNIL